jgi:copper resistance protein B
MKKTMFTPLAMSLLLADPVWAQHPEHHVPNDPNEVEPYERGYPADYVDMETNPEVTEGIQKYAIDEPGDTPTNFGVQPVHDNEIFAFLYVDRLEERFQKNADVLLWDATGWVGNDYHKLFLETEGEYNTSEGDFEESRNELLYGYTIAPFWTLQGGYRHDFINNKDDRDFAVFSVQGMTPFQFEVDAASYISDEGDISALIEAEYSFRLSQRSQLIPRFETAIAVQDVEDYNIASGINGFTLGARLNYQITREFAPYIGVSWERSLFDTADLIREDGGDTSTTAFVVGVRLIF